MRLAITRGDIISMISSVIKENEKKSKAAQESAFRRMIITRGNEEYIDAIIKIIFNLEYNRAFAAVFPPTEEQIHEMAQKRKALKEEEDKEVTLIKGIISGRLLELVMLNGKHLKDCTGAECLKLGGFYATIGDKIGMRKTVGSMFTEGSLRKLAETTWRISFPISMDSENRVAA